MPPKEAPPSGPTSEPLPGPLKSVYRQYKQDTNFVASWLATTAKRCGYPADLLSEAKDGPSAKSSGTADAAKDGSASRPKGTGGKGKKKKKPKKSTKTAESSAAGPKRYTVAVDEYIPLAQFICSSKQGTATVPEWFVTAINRVIQVRKGFSAKLTEHGRKPEAASDLRHNYFVGILEQVREVLRPRMTADAARASDLGLSNKFEGLSVSEPSQEFLDAPDIERTKSEVVYEAEESLSDEEAIFYFWLLWEDLLRTRTVVRTLWFTYACKEHELPAVALASNTALDLARHDIAEVFVALEKQERGFFGVLKDHHIMVWDFVTTIIDPRAADMIGLSENPSKEELRYVAGKESYVNAYNMLARILPALQPGGEPIGPVLQSDGTFEAKRGSSRFDKDYNILQKVFEDLMFINEHIASRSAESASWPHAVEDALMRGLRETLETRKIPFYLVFASQVLLDVHHELGEQDIHMPKDEMLQKMDVMCDMFTEYHRIHGSTGTYDDLEDIDCEVRSAAFGCLQMQDDPIYEKQMELLKKKKLHVTGSKPEKHGFWKRHPIACGLLLYMYQLVYYKTGIHVANVTRSVVASMHMYNALRSEGLLKDVWDDMEAAKTFLGPGNFFVGHVPANMDAYVKGIMLQLGISIVSLMDPSKRRGSTRAKMLDDAGVNRRIRWGVPTWMAFDDRFLANFGRVASDNWTAEDVHAIVAGYIKESGDKPSIPDKDADGKSRGKPKSKTDNKDDKQPEKSADGATLRTHELVNWLCKALTSEYRQISFPWLVLHAYAWWMMRCMTEECEPLVIRVLGPPDGKLKEYALPCNAAHILQAAYLAPNRAQGRRIMKVAAEAFCKTMYSRMTPEIGGKKVVDDTGNGYVWGLGSAATMYYKRLGNLPPWTGKLRSRKGENGEWVE